MDKERIIAIDLDGTLAAYAGYQGPGVIGAVIKEMADRMQQATDEGAKFVIFTARITPKDGSYQAMREATQAYLAIARWCQENLGTLLPIANQKMNTFHEFWDDRGRQVVKNAGVFAEELLAPQEAAK